MVIKSLGPGSLNFIPKRKIEANKGTYGHVLIIAGSLGMAGAAYLSALSAYRSGAGLVRILTVGENRSVLQAALPEAIITAYSLRSALESPRAFTNLINSCLSWASVIVLGPGLSTEPHAKILVEQVLQEAYVPVIVDADALNIIAQNPFLTGFYTENIIITPHMGEMARLTGKTIEEIVRDPQAAACVYQEAHGITCVLKSHKTVIATKDDILYLNQSGSPAMAKAGSGDVLCGIIAGMFCLGLEDSLAVALGVYIHGLAGERAAAKIGEHSIIARDIIGAIGFVMQEGGKNSDIL